MKSLGIGADVVSSGELKRAISAGITPEKIIFEGVGKSKEDIVDLIKEFKNAQKEKHADLKAARKELVLEVRERIQKGDRRE